MARAVCSTACEQGANGPIKHHPMCPNSSPLMARDVVERLRECRVYDETDTLPAVSQIVILSEHEAADLLAVVEAAQKFSDSATCLDETCTHKVCVLNKALARLYAGSSGESD